MDIERPGAKQPMPDDAKKVFSGEIFDVYQCEQEMFDGSKATFEKLKRADSVNVIPVTDDGKLILSEQKQPGVEPFIGVLGGRVDEGETPLDTAKRELLEEAGMKAENFVLWRSEQFSDKIDWAIYTFVAKGCKKVQEQSSDPGEKIKLIEVTFDEFLELVAKENYRDLEISLAVFRLSKDKHEMESVRKLFASED